MNQNIALLKKYLAPVESRARREVLETFFDPGAAQEEMPNRFFSADRQDPLSVMMANFEKGRSS